MDSERSKKIEYLFYRYSDGSITKEEMDLFNSLILESESVQDKYLEFVKTEIALNHSFQVNIEIDTNSFQNEEDSNSVLDSNTSLRGVDLSGLNLDADVYESEESDLRQEMLEILELVRTSPAVEIEKPKPVKEKPELIQKVVHPPREKRKLSKFHKFFFTATAAAVIFFVLLVKFTPEPVPSVDVATVSDQMNVKWSQSSNSLKTGSRLWTKDFPLDIKEGIVSIEFDEGVQVVIEGPAVFEVERLGIYLKYGRLYGKVSETGLGFTVRTPTSQFIDQGTEFGVLADINGSSELHVTKGKVRLIAGLVREAKIKKTITENKAIKFDAVNDIVKAVRVQRESFVRHIDSKSGVVWKGQTQIDLSDIFGGGDGFGSGKIGTYLDVRTGKFTSLQGGSDKGRGLQKPDETFITVDQSPFIDSVFTPDGGDGSVQISSVGHVFDNCPDTSGWIGDSNIFNGDTINIGKLKRPVELGNGKYGTKENPAITIKANRGITFDLEAIRRSMGVDRFERFTAKCGINWRGRPSENKADIHVLVDGQVRFNPIEKRIISEPFNVDVPLGRDDRFLTLVVTKEERSGSGNTMVIAEPILHIGG